MVYFRAVRESDAAALAELRRPYAEKYPAKAPDAGSILREIRRLTTAYPYLVAEVNDQVVGCAFAAPLRDDPAYQWDAEVRIYCAEAFHGQGLGSAADAAAYARADGSGLCACMCHGGPAQRCGAGLPEEL